jgi:hypothetical protein
MIAFIDDHREVYGVEPIYHVLPIAPSTYHAHVAQSVDPDRQSGRQRRDAVLKAEVSRLLTRTSRSMACARLGGSLGGRITKRRVAPSRD